MTESHDKGVNRILAIARKPGARRFPAFFKPSWMPLLAGGPGGATAALLPENWNFAAPASAARVIEYQGELSITRHLAQWQALRNDKPVEVHVVGDEQLGQSADALAIAAYLPAEKVIYHSPAGQRDVSHLVRPLKVDFARKTPAVRRLSRPEATRWSSDITRHYIELFAENGYVVPRKENRQRDVQEHFSKAVGLAQDLMMRSPEISGNPWWRICLADDGDIVESLDRTLAFARFLEKLPDVHSALEIGCGSGFVTLFLAGGRYEGLMGTDSSPERVHGARTLADLSGIKAEFQVMGAERIEVPDKSFDVVFSCFVLEQCAEVLDRVLDECIRVARKFAVFFEPSIEVHPTIPGLVHIPMHGFPTDYVERFMRRGYAFSIIRPPLRSIYNPGVIHVVAVDERNPPHVTCPALISKVAMIDA